MILCELSVLAQEFGFGLKIFPGAPCSGPGRFYRRGAQLHYPDGGRPARATPDALSGALDGTGPENFKRTAGLPFALRRPLVSLPSGLQFAGALQGE